MHDRLTNIGDSGHLPLECGTLFGCMTKAEILAQLACIIDGSAFLAGAVRAFVEEVPESDVRFTTPHANAKQALSYWAAQRDTSGGVPIGSLLGFGVAGAAPGTVWLASPQMQLFWRVLQSKECMDNVAGCTLLRMRGNARFLGNPRCDSVCMLVRRDYEGIYKHIKDNESRNGRIVVTGTPGIGKTMFMFPLMHWLVDEAHAIVLELGKDRFLFRKGHDVLQGSAGEDAFWVELDNVKTWWILNGASEPSQRSALTILLTSPDKNRYKNFLKLWSATKLYMPLWTDEELELCRVHCFPDLSQETVRNLQDKWGNIPRYVLEKAEDEAAQGSLDSALRLCEWRDIRNCISEADSVHGTSHKLVHIAVVERYCKVQMVFASRYVTDKLVQHVASRRLEWLADLVSRTIVEEHYCAAAGQFFESFAHHLLQQGGSFQVRKLDHLGATEVLNLPMAADVKIFRKLEEVKDAAEHTYCQPKANNFPGIDALLQPCTLFQMTVAQTDNMDLAGLINAKRHLRMHGIPCRLYFVVPAQLFDEFKAAEHVPESIEQWALKVPLPGQA